MRLAKLVLITVTCCFLNGCCALCQLVNKTWPPKTTWDAQYDATLQSASDLGALTSPNTFVALKQSDWKPYLESLVKSKLPQITAVSITAGQQELVAQVGFSGDFPLNNGKKIGLAGGAEVHFAPSFNGNTLNVTPALYRKITLTRASYNGADMSLWVAPVNVALNSLMDNINGALGTYAFKIEPDVFQQFNPVTEFAGTPSLSTFGNPLSIHLNVDHAALLVDTGGLYVLGQLNEAPTDLVAAGLSKMAAGPISPADLVTPEIRAVRAECPHFRRLTADARAQSLIAACDTLDQLLKPPLLAAHPPVTEAQFLAEFNAFKPKFASAVQTTTTTPFTSFTTTSATVQKAFLAQAITSATKDAAMGAVYAAPGTRVPFDDDLKTEKAPNLNCGGITIPCFPNYNCPDANHCGYSCASGRSCPGSCAWYDAGCIAWKGLCETLKAGEQAGCEAGRAVCITGCEGKKIAETLACNVRIAAAQAGCVINQAWLNLWDQKNIGNIKGTASVTNARVALEIKATSQGSALQVAPDFSKFTIRGTASAEADVNASFTYTPLDLGHILCVAKWSGGVSAHAHARLSPEYEFAGSISSKQLGDSVQLSITTSPVKVTLGLDPPPVEALFEQNPQFALVCAPAAIIGVTAQIFGDLRNLVTGKSDPYLLQGNFDFEIPSFSTPIVIQPLALTFPTGSTPVTGPSLQLRPVWQATNVLFRK